MTHKPILVGLALTALILGGLPGRTLAAAKDPEAASTLMAERFFDFAQNVVPQQAATVEHRRQMAALLEAAWRLNPQEPRFARPLADELMHQGKADRALNVLNALRKVRPQDRVVQVRVIEAYLAGMQTVDQKLDYLRNVINASAVPEEVRSEAALHAAALLLEKGRPEESQRMVEQALKLNPVNMRALQARYRALPVDAPVAQRMELVLGMLLANPTDVEALLSVARTAAHAGLIEDSLRWYEQVIPAAHRSASPLIGAAVFELAVQQLLAGKTDLAIGYLDQLVAHVPSDYTALVLAMTAHQQKGNSDRAEQLRIQAGNVLINQLQAVRGRMGIQGATTRPVTEGRLFPPVPNELIRDIDAFKAHPDLQREYLNYLGDFAWFELYFHRQIDFAQQLETTLNRLSLEAEEENRISDSFAARLSGWSFLLRNRLDEAKVKLSAAGQQDALAAMGMVRVTAATDKAAAKQAAQKLLDQNASGVTAVLIQQGLAEHEVRVGPTEAAASIRPLLARFPMEWLKVISNPVMFYSLRGEPVRISSPYGQPVLAAITLQNTSEYDLTIGQHGVIKPHLWFDVQMGGGNRGRFDRAAIASIPDFLVLKPRQKTSFLVRIDQGPLRDALAANPQPAIGMVVTVRSNVLVANGALLSGPAGYSVDFRRMMERSPFALTEQSYRGLLETLATSRGAERIRAIQMLHTIAAARSQSAQQSGDPTARTEAAAIGEAVLTAFRKLWFDADPDIKAYSAYICAIGGPEADRADLIGRMIADEAWQVRLLGAMAMGVRNAQTGAHLVAAERQRAWLQDLLARETEPHVRDYAAAALDLLNQPAQPATQPAPRG